MNIIKLVAIIAGIVLAILYSFLHYFISLYAILPTLALIYYIARQVCIIMTFPASIKLYYRFVLANKSVYFASKALQKCSIISNTINNHNYPNHVILDAILYLHSQQQIYTQMNRKTSLQYQYHNHLKKLTELLQPHDIEKLHNENKHQIKDVVQGLIIFLDDYIQQTTKKGNFAFFGAQDFLGTLTERRLYLLISNPKAQRIIIKNQVSLDVLHIRSSPDAPTVLYCNPNAGFYEYAYQDCDWFNFYKTLNYNIITWNYRSFGASEGKISPQNCISDAEYLVDYFRKEFGYQTFGIHGHSLGGMIAQEVAYSKNMSFLIADRTFSSLGQTASKMLGSSAARFVFQLVTGWDKPNYLQYYNFSGPKLIIQDTSDEMIPYTSQLQTSIVRCYFTGAQKPSLLNQLFDQESDSYMRFFYNKVINQADMALLCALLTQLIQYIMKIQNQDNQQESMQNAQYIELVNDDDQKRDFAQGILEKFCQIHYNENTLIRVLSDHISAETIALFFGSCFAFGQKNGQFLQDYNKFERDMINFLSSEQVQRKQELSQITNLIGKIVAKLSALSQEHDNPLRYTNEQDGKTKVGELLPVFCGHNNNLSEIELKQVVHFLRTNRLIIQ